MHIFSPPIEATRIIAGDCPDCGTWTRFLGWRQEWFGWYDTCLRCGRQWGDGEWIPLEFARGIRQYNIQHAKDLWRRLHPKNAREEES